MKFRLFYRGQLKSNGGSKEKQELRRKFHLQLKELWRQKPLNPEFLRYIEEPYISDSRSNKINIIKKAGSFSFVPIVCETFRTIADLDITFLRPEEPGSILTKGGDIDNRIKTLLDGLRIPKINEIPPPPMDCPQDGENPFFCLLEDDALVTHLSVTTDRLLEFNDLSEVVLLISVTVRVAQPLGHNIGLIG